MSEAFVRRPDSLRPGFVPQPTDVGQAIKTIEADSRQLDGRPMVDRSLNTDLPMLISVTEGETAFDLREAIRDAAQRAYESRIIPQSPRLRILEIGPGLPLKALSFYGGSEKVLGKILEYGTYRHTAPVVESTVISDKDHLEEFILTLHKLFPTVKDVIAKSLATDVIDRVLGVPPGLPDDEARDTRLANYARLKTGQLTLRLTDDGPVAALGKLPSHEKYDFAFPNLPAVADRIAYLQAIQARLDPNGLAVVPIKWGRSGADTVKTFLNDSVRTPEGDIPFEDHLARVFPGVFRVVRHMLTKILVVHGTAADSPVKLPLFYPSRREPDRNSNIEGVSLLWTPVTNQAPVPRH